MPSGGFPTSHPSYVSFGGVTIGSLTNWRVTAGTAHLEETTNVTSTVVGSGANARIIKSYDCTAIDPGGVDITLFGCPPCVVTDIGTLGLLTVSFQGGMFSANAYLESFDVTGAVGQMLVGNARFRFSGTS